jgi:hypothetical protein
MADRIIKFKDKSFVFSAKQLGYLSADGWKEANTSPAVIVDEQAPFDAAVFDRQMAIQAENARRRERMVEKKRAKFIKKKLIVDDDIQDVEF